MRIGIRFNIEESASGSRKTIAECLIIEIVKQHPNSIILTNNANFFLKRGIDKTKIIKTFSFNIKNVILNTIFNKIYDQICLERVAIKHGCQLLYYPYNIDAIWKTNTIPQIITVHDLIPLIYPEQFKKLKFFWMFLVVPTIKQSQKIITVSNNTKKDLINILNVNSNKIEVIYNGFNNLNSDNVVNEIICNNILYVASTLYQYKNIINTIKAFNLLNVRLPGYKLIIVGSNVSRFRMEIEKVVNTNTVLLQHLSNIELIDLYKNASLFVYPSFYEGFGIPPLEAMSFGIPVAASNQASMPEICGDAALYFDPNNIDDITLSMFTLLTDESLRKEMILKGKRQIAKYQWENSAKLLIDVIEHGTNYN